MMKLNDKGNATIILCLVMTALLGITAYVVDIGLIYSQRIKLSNAIDSAALAAALELPNDSQKAKDVAFDYLEKNNIDSADTRVTISDDNKSIQIEGIKNIKHFFAPLIGIDNTDTIAETTAIVGPAKSVKEGIRPFAVQIFNFSYGDIVVLKENAGDGYRGNYGAIALGGQGASTFKSNALYGYIGTISVGDMINTETGNMAGATSAIRNYINSENSTFDNFPRSSIRLWTIPLVDTLEVNGRGEIEVVGFAQFYVESIDNNAGHIEITGRFVKYVINATVDMNLRDTGSYGAKLSK